MYGTSGEQLANPSPGYPPLPFALLDSNTSSSTSSSTPPSPAPSPSPPHPPVPTVVQRPVVSLRTQRLTPLLNIPTEPSAPPPPLPQTPSPQNKTVHSWREALQSPPPLSPPPPHPTSLLQLSNTFSVLHSPAFSPTPHQGMASSQSPRHHLEIAPPLMLDAHQHHATQLHQIHRQTHDHSGHAHHPHPDQPASPVQTPARRHVSEPASRHHGPPGTSLFPSPSSIGQLHHHPLTPPPELHLSANDQLPGRAKNRLQHHRLQPPHQHNHPNAQRRASKVASLAQWYDRLSKGASNVTGSPSGATRVGERSHSNLTVTPGPSAPQSQPNRVGRYPSGTAANITVSPTAAAAAAATTVHPDDSAVENSIVGGTSIYPKYAHALSQPYTSTATVATDYSMAHSDDISRLRAALRAERSARVDAEALVASLEHALRQSKKSVDAQKAQIDELTLMLNQTSAAVVPVQEVLHIAERHFRAKEVALKKIITTLSHDNDVSLAGQRDRRKNGKHRAKRNSGGRHVGKIDNAIDL